MLALGMRQRMNCSLQAQPGERLRLAGPWPEPRPPEEPLCLPNSKAALPHSDTRHKTDIGSER
jgi:hypothetical protein